MNLDYFIVYKEEEHNFKEKIGLFIGSEDKIKNLIYYYIQQYNY